MVGWDDTFLIDPDNAGTKFPQGINRFAYDNTNIREQGGKVKQGIVNKEVDIIDEVNNNDTDDSIDDTESKNLLQTKQDDK